MAVWLTVAGQVTVNRTHRYHRQKQQSTLHMCEWKGGSSSQLKLEKTHSHMEAGCRCLLCWLALMVSFEHDGPHKDKVHPSSSVLYLAMTSPHRHLKSDKISPAAAAQVGLLLVITAGVRTYLQALDKFAVIKLGGGALVRLGEWQVEPQRLPLLGSCLVPVAGFAETTVAGSSTSCPGHCLDLGLSEAEVGLVLQPAFPRVCGRSGREGRQGDKLHFSRFGHLDEQPVWTSLRTHSDNEEKSYFAKLLQIDGLKKVSRSSDGCSVPTRQSGPPPNHMNPNPEDAAVGEKLFFRKLLASSACYVSETFTGAILGLESK